MMIHFFLISPSKCEESGGWVCQQDDQQPMVPLNGKTRDSSVTPLSPAASPSVGKRRENGEKTEKTVQCFSRAFVSLVPSSRALYFPSPHSPAYRKDERDLCGGESVTPKEIRQITSPRLMSCGCNPFKLNLEPDA